MDRAQARSEGDDRDRLRSERSRAACRAVSPESSRIPVMRLVWSQPSGSMDRPRSLVLLGVVCIFFGGAVAGRPGDPDTPRAFRAAAASLVGTGFLACLAGSAALIFARRKPGPSLTLANPSRPSTDPARAGLREEEQW